VLGRRVRTAAGEIDILAAQDGLLAVIEVKHRKTLVAAIVSLSARQRARLMLAAEIVMGENPAWGQQGVRFDVIVVDAAFTIRRVTDAFRQEG
jgi:putative endonuclease